MIKKVISGENLYIFDSKDLVVEKSFLNIP